VTEALLLKTAIALVPVVIFLAGFAVLDAFRVVSWRMLLLLLAAGGALAAVSYAINWRALDDLPIGFTNYTKYGAPLVEEPLKAALMLALFLRNRVGFMIDAAIAGFAIGAGFSLIENVIYLYNFAATANEGVWLVRGFGTAVMHGSATAAFGVISQYLIERRSSIEQGRYRINPVIFLPGLIVAIVIHGLYNHFPDQPLLAMTLILFVAPLSLVLVFFKSEHAAHKWLLTEYETHEHMLEDMRAGRLQTSEAGRFILTLSERFDLTVVAAAFEYLKTYTELTMTAEETLLDHEEGRAAPAARDVRAEFERLHELERRMGGAALLAIRPHLHFSRRELWEIHELQREARA
jgi:RsiW-degrading membrane proteinase PrsW (M82 family)